MSLPIIKPVPDESDNVDVDDDHESGSVSSSSASGSGSGFTGHDSKTNEAETALLETFKKEEIRVRNVRIVICIAIVVMTAAVTAAIWIFAQASEYSAFQLEYNSFSKSILSLVQWEIVYNFALMQQFSAVVTTAGLMTNASYPYFTMNEYEITGGYVDGMGGIMACAYSPLIDSSQRAEWEQYSWDNQDWIIESARLKKVESTHRDALHGTIQDHEHDRRRLQEQERISPSLWRWENGQKVVEPTEPDKLYAPMWQVSPASYTPINVNLLSDPRVEDLFVSMVSVNESIMSPMTKITDLWDFMFDPEEKPQKEDPHGMLMEPVYRSFEAAGNRELVGFLLGLTSWKNKFNMLLPEGVEGIYAVVKDSCNSTMTFWLNGTKAVYLGEDDHHETAYDQYEREMPMELYKNKVDTMCEHHLYVYPSAVFENSYKTSGPAIYTSVVALAFVLTSLLFIIYDVLVSRRQQKTLTSAIRTNQIVSSLFPAGVRERILEEQQKDEKGTDKKHWLAEDGLGVDNMEGVYATRPIADFFPDTTVMFADISGFTAWSSTREPFQVFTLLETIYGALDAIAKRRGVFKVETVGDCYVAVCGVPKERKDHAVVMARFARDSINKMHEVTRKLEVVLGPDTADLDFRIGLHSGPVTGGVLRGDNARFQLFGDTMNTTARIESTGIRGRVQISQETANRLAEAGKDNWFVARDSQVHAKGKGDLQTYLLTVGSNDKNETSSATGSHVPEKIEDIKLENEQAHNEMVNSEKTMRLVRWNVDVLLRLLKQVVATRNACAARESEDKDASTPFKAQSVSDGQTVLDEVKEIISLPDFAQGAGKIDVNKVELDVAAEEQCLEYVQNIAMMYHANPFHNFEHASHVAMSVTKLLSRIIAPTNIKNNKGDSEEALAATLHDHTYGITSDPLTQFACVFSALIHDVDHPGVPNMQLIKENPCLANFYREKSVAEQNSVDLAWGLLMDDRFIDLRRTIFATQAERTRFRQLVVNSVMATDIMDKDLKLLRNNRWDRAFDPDKRQNEDIKTSTDRKATIVIEHLIQASDVAHTMQHWHIYRKWNERLFEEMYKAFKEGRAETDPSTNWYKGEMGFFDFYIIPLARKLKDCGVFGVSSDEYLNYAVKNRSEWEIKGKEVVEGMIEKISAKSYGPPVRRLSKMTPPEQAPTENGDQ